MGRHTLQPPRDARHDQHVFTETATTRRRRHVVVGLELFTGFAAMVGGLLLIIEPDGSLLQAEMSSLQGSPFENWRLPGVLLATLVGGGFLLAAACTHWDWRDARTLSIVAGLGLVMFEVVEMMWLGLQPLEFAFSGVGLALVVLSVRQPRTR
jgi:hypothetical protein